jgi:Phage capsid family
VADTTRTLEQRSASLAMSTREGTLRRFALEQRDATATKAADLLRTAGSMPSTHDQVSALLAESEQWAARAEDYAERSKRRAETARVVREPLTYRAGGEHSWLHDLAIVKLKGDDQAAERLKRHQREMAVEQRARSDRSERRSRGDVPEPEGTTFERRVLIDSPGAPASSTPPLWLGALTATLPRAERCLSDLIPSFDLPDGVASVNIPRLTAGGVEQHQAPNMADPANDITDAATSSQCVLLSGHVDIPLQALEQSPAGAASYDEILWRDLLSAWDAELEKQIVVGKGNGSNWQLLGLLNVEGVNTIAYTTGTPTAVALFKPLGEAFGLVSNTRKIRPELWAMRGGRWAWLATGEDKQERPISPPIDVQSPTAPAGPVGTLIGNTPVYTSESIPSTIEGNQDVILGLRPRDALLWEGAPIVAIDRQTLSGTLQARVHLRAYAALIASRYPSSIVSIGGTGMAVPTNF